MVFMVCVAAASSAVVASGLGGELGMTPQTGIQDDVQQSEDKFKEYDASRSGDDTSFIGSVISGVDKTIETYQIIFALPTLLTNMGLPGWLAALIGAPAYFLFGLFVVYMITGRRTTGRI
jgi:hypothetical protein